MALYPSSSKSLGMRGWLKRYLSSPLTDYCCCPRNRHDSLPDAYCPFFQTLDRIKLFIVSVSRSEQSATDAPRSLTNYDMVPFRTVPPPPAPLVYTAVPRKSMPRSRYCRSNFTPNRRNTPAGRLGTIPVSPVSSIQARCSSSVLTRAAFLCSPKRTL